MRNRLVLPSKADTRYLRIHFPNLDSRTFSREVGECPYSTHANTCYRLQAPMEMLQWLCSSVHLQGRDSHLSWETGMRLSQPAIQCWHGLGRQVSSHSHQFIFHYWYLNVCIPLALAQIVPSTERQVDEKGTIERLKHHCVTDTA